MATIKYRGRSIIVDDDILPMLARFNWHISSHGYAHTSMGAKKILLHRFIMGAKEFDVVDHKNGNKLDNRKSNLRFATKSQNAQNARKQPSKTGFIGVNYEYNGAIKANIKYANTKRHLGVFPSLIEAAKAYDEAALRLFGPEARTNLKHFTDIVLQLKRGKKA
jgi:hypothetical protein